MKMQRACVSILTALAVMLSFAILQPVEAKTIQLTYSIFFPATHAQCQAGVEWAREVEKRSNGQVQITVFPGGTLTKDNQCYDGVVKGISDIGMSVFAYTRGRFPVMEAADLPLGYPDGLTATRTVNAFYDKFRPEELSDVKVLYLHAHGPGLLHTRTAVRSLENLKNMKIRSTGLSAKVVEALGAVPVAMPQGATYESLQKGVVEGTFGPIEVLKGWRQAEVIKATTDCDTVGYTTAMFVVMNPQKWAQLPPEVQDVMTAVSREWIDVHGKSWDSSDAMGREFTLSLGNEIIPLDEAEGARWSEAVAPIIAEYAASADQKGLKGSESVAELKRLIGEFSGQQ
ncbi:MAG: TRAP transporter substrate-binding protein [Desulfobacterales bacterium]